MRISLSRFYPRDTVYFHFFPSGGDSGFFNPTATWVDELAAGRALTCAGDNVKVIVFEGTTTSSVLGLLRDKLGMPVANTESIMFIPDFVSSETGELRSEIIKNELKKLVGRGKLVISQPYDDASFNDVYAISPSLIIKLNDKAHMAEFIPSEFLPQRYGEFKDGKTFAGSEEKFPLPCVVKVASSGAGDGVVICRNENDFEVTRKRFADNAGAMVIDEFIDTAHNLGVQFGVPFEKNRPIEMVGINEQLTTADGGFLGGIINPSHKIAGVAGINKIMLQKVLPRVREMGWYGAGGIDVLVGKNGKIYFIDCNFRLTAASSYLYQIQNGDVKGALVHFTCSFKGTEEDFVKKMVPLAAAGSHGRIFDIVNLAKHGDGYKMHAALIFSDGKEMVENAKKLIKAGVESLVLEKILSGDIKI